MYFCKNNFHVQDMHFKIRPNYVFDFYFIYPISSIACNYALLLYLYSQHFAFCLQNFEFFFKRGEFFDKEHICQKNILPIIGRFDSFSFIFIQKVSKSKETPWYLHHSGDLYIYIQNFQTNIFISFFSESIINQLKVLI